MSTKIALVSCVKTKRETAAAACDLYISPLFMGMRRYSEQKADGWYILSAEHGVLRPDEVVAPYERTLKTMSKQDRATWVKLVQRQLLELLPADAEVVVLASDRYREGVVSFLKDHGFTVEVPMAGLRLGEQLRWLKGQVYDERSRD